MIVWFHKDIYSITAIYKKIFTQLRKIKHNRNKNNKKNIFNKHKRRCRDVKTQKACNQGWGANIGPKIKQTTSYISTAFCILFYSSESTYVGLYGSGLVNFGS